MQQLLILLADNIGMKICGKLYNHFLKSVHEDVDSYLVVLNTRYLTSKQDRHGELLVNVQAKQASGIIISYRYFDGCLA